ncbi:hypothetical protein DPMN_152117 [Dreissena polymorpha]|uniref:Uncharacterized protein n=1 Tax=Dreissena polymorpha TaxID=45954 RepID=A0A9D4J817_DREPO|nr:hypothetical protein DPMN_152117 [Dreissena polymorpha]
MVQEYQEETAPVWYSTRIPGGNPTGLVWYKNTREKPHLSGMVQEFRRIPHLSGMVQEYQEETTPVRYGTRIRAGNRTSPVWYKNTRGNPTCMLWYKNTRRKHHLSEMEQ